MGSPDFSNYDAVDYWPTQWAALSGHAARAEYRRFLTEIPGRVAAFEDLLRRNGLPVGYEQSALQAVNDWFLENVTADASGAWPARVWRSFVMDVGLFLGEGVLERHPHLRWELAVTAPKREGYRQHVLVGFQSPWDRTRRIPPSAVLFTYANHAIQTGADIVIIDGAPVEIAQWPVKKQRFAKFFEAINQAAEERT